MALNNPLELICHTKQPNHFISVNLSILYSFARNTADILNLSLTLSHSLSFSLGLSLSQSMFVCLSVCVSPSLSLCLCVSFSLSLSLSLSVYIYIYIYMRIFMSPYFVSTCSIFSRFQFPFASFLLFSLLFLSFFYPLESPMINILAGSTYLLLLFVIWHVQCKTRVNHSRFPKRHHLSDRTDSLCLPLLLLIFLSSFRMNFSRGDRVNTVS